MGATYAKAFINKTFATSNQLMVVEKYADKLDELKTKLGIRVHSEIDADIATFDVIIVAVKPQDFRVMAEKLKTFLKASQLVISIMAGITIEKITALLDHINVVRAMPNTPAQLGFGITAYSASPGNASVDLDLADRILKTTGKAIFMEDENMLDAVTALSGSGPAYYYYFVKHMIEAGIQMGLDEATAALLVKQTMLGAYQIMDTSEATLDDMIKMVASKGGTTEAALNTLEAHEVGPNIVKALQAARSRAHELSQGA